MILYIVYYKHEFSTEERVSQKTNDINVEIFDDKIEIYVIVSEKFKVN
jgi:hypothetical protein